MWIQIGSMFLSNPLDDNCLMKFIRTEWITVKNVQETYWNNLEQSIPKTELVRILQMRLDLECFSLAPNRHHLARIPDNKNRTEI